ncbi:DUF5686 and carboxypeptidase regulatory-like domain-containing protein [Lutibacter sp. A80]|uniref:DUF5686 and carboxypeptidase regulatory-like domain-containing protein n=1 Tax=Lutibacter sp. A80 TaxID=2918453 RepID=UPI001F051EF1|nr:DUF5686 and carboxypeptidase regulatory-like domain-containing protein [Lutibacter sp. A80]UMB59354.1 DUF5686 and carboxypeptidase regulatory-like domain-containing protein [Lutibacter sp. A80]
MVKITTLFFFIFISIQLSAQVKGTIKNSKNETLPFVSVYIENTSTGTSSNEQGLYELPVLDKGNYTVVFQYLGYVTLKKEIEINTLPFQLDVILNEESIQLNEVTISSKENPAIRIIKNTIENRKRYLNKITAYTSDFYSKGIFRIKNAPDKIFGQKVGDLGGGLDSTRSGVVYLSETVSKISFKQPNLFKEKILASKVSGNNSGFSFNQASEVNFNFYKNTIDLESKVISPIASYALNYYTYKLIGTFYEGTHLINKIEVTPKKKTDNAFSGIIYIVEDDWAIYGVNLTITGAQMGQPMIEELNLKHSYSYAKNKNYWPLISQQIYFKFGMLGINVDGQISTAYSNYNFNPQFKENEFNNEILSFVENSNKKDSLYWETVRPIILTKEEVTDYKIKDSIQVLKKSKSYLDSIDKKDNKFKISDILMGYSYKNTYKNQYLDFSSVLLGTSFNTVQGWNPSMDISYYTSDKDAGSSLSVKTNVNYGLSDKKLRATASLSYLFNSISKPYLQVSGGKKVTQFNQNEPISGLINSVSTLFFEENYAKYYDKTYAKILFSDELSNGVRMQSTLSYEKRSPLVNTTDYVLLNDKQKTYTSNDPLNENNNGIPSFEAHNVYQFSTAAIIRFGQKYISYPNRKINKYNSDYPSLTLMYNQNFASSKEAYNFGEVGMRIQQAFDIDNKGAFSYNVKAGTFFEADDIAFVDYKHFNGNQTHVNMNYDYTNAFNLMPYYNFSTNQSYVEFHAEHNFKGYLLNKLPLINKLGFELVLGAKSLIRKDKKPYSELSVGLGNIGIGKLRFLRLDYVKSNYNGVSQNGIVFGLSF